MRRRCSQHGECQNRDQHRQSDDEHGPGGVRVGVHFVVITVASGSRAVLPSEHDVTARQRLAAFGTDGTRGQRARAQLLMVSAAIADDVDPGWDMQSMPALSTAQRVSRGCSNKNAVAVAATKLRLGRLLGIGLPLGSALHAWTDRRSLAMHEAKVRPERVSIDPCCTVLFAHLQHNLGIAIHGGEG